MMQSPSTNLLILASALFAFSGASVAADVTDPVADLKTCARTEDSTARIACYEALGKRVLGEDSNVAEPGPDRLPDNLGGGDYEEKKVKAKAARGHVKSCRQASDGRWYFTFESGQVWVQSSKGHYRYKNCDFDVSITKDIFSYKMAIDGGRTIRVRRKK